MTPAITRGRSCSPVDRFAKRPRSDASKESARAAGRRPSRAAPRMLHLRRRPRTALIRIRPSRSAPSSSGRQCLQVGEQCRAARQRVSSRAGARRAPCPRASSDLTWARRVSPALALITFASVCRRRRPRSAALVAARCCSDERAAWLARQRAASVLHTRGSFGERHHGTRRRNTRSATRSPREARNPSAPSERESPPRRMLP